MFDETIEIAVEVGGESLPGVGMAVEAQQPIAVSAMEQRTRRMMTLDEYRLQAATDPRSFASWKTGRSLRPSLSIDDAVSMEVLQALLPDPIVTTRSSKVEGEVHVGPNSTCCI